jgi:hypothetical protein
VRWTQRHWRRLQRWAWQYLLNLEKM